MIRTLAQALGAVEAFPLVEPRRFVRRGLVVVAPHPDDESLGCGGLIAACGDAGLPVTLIIVSDGTGSHPSSPRHPPARLASLRRSEATEAARRLGLERGALHFLDLPDRDVPAAGPDAEAAVDRIAGLSAAADVIAVTWRHDPHCDHRASFRLARRAAARVPGAALWEYPVWGLTLPAETPLDEEATAGVRVPVGRFLPTKRAAIAAHASQVTNLISDDPDGFRLAPDMLARFDGPFETYFGPSS